MFPLNRILDEDEFKGMDIVVCGHSLGGAIASVVAVKFIGLKHFLQKGAVKCITFGAPLIGDEDLQHFISDQMSSHFHHFVCIKDPVPQLLRYTQSVKPKLQYIDNRLSTVKHTMQFLEDTSSAASTLKNLLAMKDSYINVIETINQVMPTIRAAVNIASLVCPNILAVTQFQKIFTSIKDVMTAIKDDKDVYTPFGNFHFLDENLDTTCFFSCDKLKELEKYMEVSYQQNANRVNQYAHALSNYTQLFQEKRILPFETYHLQIQRPNNDPRNPSIYNNREILFNYPYQPVIHSVELSKVKGKKSFLNLSFIGKNLFDVVLDLCQFDFNFPFLKNRENVTIKKISMGKNIERLVIKDEMKDFSISISDHGTRLLLVTQFGKCEKLILRENVRNINVESVNQIAQNDSVSLVVRRAIQRGMALKKLKKESGYEGSEQIIDEIIQLGIAAIGEDEMKKKETEILEEYVNFKFVLSNEKSFQRFEDFCSKIEEYIRSPLQIEGAWSTIKALAVGVLVAAGAAVAGWVAGPSLVSIGLVETTKIGTACAGGAAGTLTGFAASKLLSESIVITDNNYKNALNFIVQELLKAQQNCLDDQVKQNIRDLLDQGNFYCEEKALTILAPKNLTLEFFRNSSISEASEKSKEEVIKRIKMIQSIHRIRKIFSQQCFIGVVGLQDAGKTTLIKKIWDVGGKSGYLSHTKVPKLYQITQKVLVVDFPGSDSLDYHSKAFSIFGAMNNMIIVVIPFSGDVSETHSQEIATVFGVMQGSESTKVILCFNKCGLYLNKLREEIPSKEKPADYLKQRFIKKLNKHYEENKRSVTLTEGDIFFTDWELEENKQSKDFGIIGINEIKYIIKKYLVEYGIYESSETDELRKCVSFLIKTEKMTENRTF